MPTAVARTATAALTARTLPYVRALADLGIAGASARHPELRAGLNVVGGRVVHPAVARSLGLALDSVEDALPSVEGAVLA